MWHDTINKVTKIIIPYAVQDKRYRRSQTSQRKKKDARISGRTVVSAQRYAPSKEHSVGRTQQDYFNLAVPETLDLGSNLRETLDFVRDFWKITFSGKQRVRLVFDVTKTIQPSALLLLGFLALLGVKSRIEKSALNESSVKFIPFMTGKELDNDASTKLRTALMGDDIAINMSAKKTLQRAISEAMLNVVQHAYPKEYETASKVRGQWWLAGKLDFDTDELQVMFCDLGYGIPKTLPKLHAMEYIRAFLSLLPGFDPNDGEMIHAAMEIGRSQTGKDNRGKGLNDLRKLLELDPNGELSIYSGAGVCVYRGDGRIKVTNGRDKIGGTLIKWSVRLSKVTNWTARSEDIEGVHNANN